jgi:hypothetical protein
LQTTLIEAAKLAPRNNPDLAMLYSRKKQKGNANRATLAVARKGGQNHGFIFWKEIAGNRIARATSY